MPIATEQEELSENTSRPTSFLTTVDGQRCSLISPWSQEHTQTGLPPQPWGGSDRSSLSTCYVPVTVRCLGYRVTSCDPRQAGIMCYPKSYTIHDPEMSDQRVRPALHRAAA